MVIGFGDLARRLVPKLSGAAEIVGVSRRPELLPEGVTAVFGDYTQRDTLAEAASLTPDVVIFTPCQQAVILKDIGWAMLRRHVIS